MQKSGFHILGNELSLYLKTQSMVEKTSVIRAKSRGLDSRSFYAVFVQILYNHISALWIIAVPHPTH